MPRPRCEEGHRGRPGGTRGLAAPRTPQDFASTATKASTTRRWPVHEARRVAARARTGLTGVIRSACRRNHQSATPCFVVATARTTSSAAIDGGAPDRRDLSPRERLAARRRGVCDKRCDLPTVPVDHDGLELPTATVSTPHKWLLANSDCAAFYLRDPTAALVHTHSIVPEFLRTTASSPSGFAVSAATRSTGPSWTGSTPADVSTSAMRGWLAGWYCGSRLARRAPSAGPSLPQTRAVAAW